MKALNTDKKLRVFVLDSLVAHSGKSLTPELISKLAHELVERAKDVFEVPLYKGEGKTA